MARRAEQVEETRRRIVEAAVKLHGTLGPAGTTIVQIAEEAGVTRLTVYRHFPDETALFAACTSHWRAGQVLPDPASWTEADEPADGLRLGLSDLYRFYRSGQDMLRRSYAERESLPEPIRAGLERSHAEAVNALLGGFPAPIRRRRRLRAVVGHAAKFETWDSLCTAGGLGNGEAVELMTALAMLAAGGKPAEG